MDQNFDRPDFPKFEAPRVEGLPYRLETCRAGPRPISLCVEKTKHFDQIHPPRPWRQKWTKILIGPISTNLKPVEKMACPTGWKLAGQAQGLLVCVLKRLKILIKFTHCGPGGKNGPNFDRPDIPKYEAP